MLSQLENDLEKVSGAWIGQLVEANHKLLLSLSTGRTTTWYHALGNAPSSGVLLWPGKLKSTQTRHGPLRWFIHDVSCCDVVIKPLVSLEGVETCTFKWRSVLWQSRHMPAAHKPKQPRILPVVEEGPGPTLVVVATGLSST